MYCKRCDRDDVGHFHRCFIGLNSVRPLKKKPTKNTPLARRLAKHYEEAIGPFPGGIDNAQIFRDQSAIVAYRDAGSWVWCLESIDSKYGMVWGFGSQWTATECAKDKTLIEMECFDGATSVAFPAFDYSLRKRT